MFVVVWGAGVGGCDLLCVCVWVSGFEGVVPE